MSLPSETIFVAILSIVMLAFVAQNIILRKKLKNIFNGGKDVNLEKALESQIKKTEALEQRTRKQHEELKRIAEQLQNAMQRISVVRFNSFDESNAQQSFTIAALDAKNNGFVLTNLQMREGGRIYAKPVGKGISALKLSQEEENAIRIAIQK